MRLLIGITAMLMAGVPSYANYCDVSKDLALEMDLRGVNRIELRSMSGDLRVTGTRSQQRATATGEACVERRYRDRIDEVRIIEERDGDVLRIIGYVPQKRNNGSRIGSLHLRVSVPDDLPIDIEDSSGDIEARNIGTVSVEDSSGDILLEQINGDVRIQRDSSGDIEIESAQDVEIRVDSSGDIDVSNVTALRIGKDSSGDIEASNVATDVTIDTDSSGSIRVSDVGGNLTVGRDGSGEIRHRRVAGDVRIPKSKR